MQMETFDCSLDGISGKRCDPIWCDINFLQATFYKDPTD